MSTSRPIPILVNERAGPPWSRTRARILRGVRGAGLEARVQAVSPGEMFGRVRALASATADTAPRIVAVAGGDGTLQTAAAALIGTGVTLAPLPAGRLNHFPRRLGIPDIRHGVRALAAGRSRTVPVGFVGDRPFLNTAVFGGYADMVRLRERLRPVLSSWPAAAVAGAAIMGRGAQYYMVIRVSGRELRRRAPVVWIGTGIGSFPGPHETTLERQSELEAVIAPAGRIAAARLAIAFFRRVDAAEIERTGRAEVIRAAELEIDASGPLPITLDGEPSWVDPPVRVVLRPDALRVISA